MDYGLKKTLPHLMALAILSLPAAASDGDADKGSRIWKKCSACHEIGPGARKKSGPQLNGIIGRAAGHEENFSYSKAMSDAGEAGLVWTIETLDEFLTRPKSMIQSTRMSFGGLKDPQDRKDLLAFLSQYSNRPEEATTDTHVQASDPKLPDETLAMSGDRDYGEYLSATCVTCHQLDGSDQGIPSITGWSREAFITVMFSYRDKHRENPVMQQIAGSLNNEEIAGLAAYFEELKSADQ